MKLISENDNSDIVEFENMTLLRYKKKKVWLIYTPINKAWGEVLPAEHKMMFHALEVEFNKIKPVYTNTNFSQASQQNASFMKARQQAMNQAMGRFW